MKIKKLFRYYFLGYGLYVLIMTGLSLLVFFTSSGFQELVEATNIYYTLGCVMGTSIYAILMLFVLITYTFNKKKSYFFGLIFGSIFTAIELINIFSISGEIFLILSLFYIYCCYKLFKF